MRVSMKFSWVYRNCSRCGKEIASLSYVIDEKYSTICQECLTEEEKKEIDSQMRKNGPKWLKLNKN